MRLRLRLTRLRLDSGGLVDIIPIVYASSERKILGEISRTKNSRLRSSLSP